MRMFCCAITARSCARRASRAVNPVRSRTTAPTTLLHDDLAPCDHRRLAIHRRGELHAVAAVVQPGEVEPNAPRRDAVAWARHLLPLHARARRRAGEMKSFGCTVQPARGNRLDPQRVA